MLGRLCLAAALPLVLIATSASAATKEEKMETCKVGAESQNLTGAKQQAFIKRCMAGGNYEPQARKDAMKKGGAKPAAAKKPAAEPAAEENPGEEND
jgi:hypothetical protein